MHRDRNTTGRRRDARNGYWRSRVLRLLRIIALIAVAWAAIALAFQRSVLYPRRMIGQTPDAAPVIPGLEVLWLDTPDGRVEGWFLEGKANGGDQPTGVVMFAHGNGEAIDHWPQPLENYRRMGLHVLLLEYRGYGRSAGSPSQTAIMSDFERWYDRLVARPQINANQIVFHGRSLGGGVMGVLAETRRPAALILESAFTSVSAMAWRAGVPPFLVLDKFDTQRAVAKLDAPLLILHGRDDQIVPVSHAHRLKQAAKRGRLALYDAGHNDGLFQFDDYWDAIETFLREHEIVR